MESGRVDRREQARGKPATGERQEPTVKLKRGRYGSDETAHCATDPEDEKCEGESYGGSQENSGDS